MSDDEIFNTGPASLARMMSLDDAVTDWREQDLAAMLAHQLNSPVPSGPAPAAPGGSPTNRFIDLFQHPCPPIERLESAKAAARLLRADPSAALQKIGTVLYYFSILVARFRCGRCITALDDTALVAGIDWVLAQPWVDPATRALFVEWRAAMR